MVVRSAFRGQGAHGEPSRFLRHAIDHAAAAPASEDHRVRSLQRLDAFGVVQVAEVLHVITHAVDEEVGRRAVATNDRCVAIPLSLCHGHARHVAGDVRHALHPLVGDQSTRHDRNRLWRVAQWSVDLHGRRAVASGIGTPLGGDDDAVEYVGRRVEAGARFRDAIYRINRDLERGGRIGLLWGWILRARYRRSDEDEDDQGSEGEHAHAVRRRRRKAE